MTADGTAATTADWSSRANLFATGVAGATGVAEGVAGGAVPGPAGDVVQGPTTAMVAKPVVSPRAFVEVALKRWERHHGVLKKTTYPVNCCKPGPLPMGISLIPRACRQDILHRSYLMG